MHRTLFDTPIVSPILRLLAQFTLLCFGWKTIGPAPKDRKYLFVAAPHTSNWDLFFMVLIASSLKVKLYWMGKESIFNFPFKRTMLWMGGIPIDRSKSNDVVSNMVDIYNSCEELVVAVPPEGTRAQTSYWKTGFYHIANGANIRICLGFLDFAKKEGGIGPMFTTTGDLEKDMQEIKAFYANITGKYPDRFKSGEDQQ